MRGLSELKQIINFIKGGTYLGRFAAARQGIPVRYKHMTDLVRQIATGQPLYILEIGSWAGGSAIVWAESLKQFNQNHGQIWCVDHWQPYFDQETGSHYRTMNRSTERAFKLFLHNTKLYTTVRHIRATSDEILPRLADQQFDIIYIDGAVRLVKPRGVICGDDLEKQFHELDDPQVVYHNAESDYVDGFHPGVTLAVVDVLGKVINKDGFWIYQTQE